MPRRCLKQQGHCKVETDTIVRLYMMGRTRNPAYGFLVSQELPLFTNIAERKVESIMGLHVKRPLQRIPFSTKGPCLSEPQCPFSPAEEAFEATILLSRDAVPTLLTG